MRNHLKRSSGFFTPYPGWAMLSGIASVAGIAAVLVFSLANEYQNYSQHAEIEVENLTGLLEEHALATVQKTDLLLREVQRAVHPEDMRTIQGIRTSRRQELHAMLRAQLESVPEVAFIHVANARGNYLYSSLDKIPGINIADRDYFKRLRDDTSAGLLISPPLVSRTTGKWTVVMCRRLSFENGSFAGVALVALDMEYFQRFYRTLNLGEHGVVSLYDMEFHLAVRYPPSEQNMGKEVSDHPAKSYIGKGIAHAVYHAKSPIDGVERLTGVRHVGSEPLFVLAGLAEEDYLAEWHQHIWQYCIGALIFSVLVMGFGMRQRSAEEQIQQLAYFDTLTNLPNRRMLFDRLNHDLARAKRYKRSMAILFLDLDKFKTINDTHGHHVGDELLKEVAIRLLDHVRSIDTVSRQGGDEFVIVLAEIAEPNDASQVAEKIVVMFGKPMLVADRELKITTSIGIAIYPSSSHTVYPSNGITLFPLIEKDEAQEMMKNADIAMYDAKNAGRNGYRFFRG